jgi:hypothetical protein
MADSPARNRAHRSPAATPARAPDRSSGRKTAGGTTWRLLLWLPVLALLGGLVLPVAAYMAGKRLIGAYEGRLGLQDYLGSVYGAAGDGEPLAWLLLLAPLLVAAIWWGIARLWQAA